jgi:uncharacterized protein (TIGR02266 family)
LPTHQRDTVVRVRLRYPDLETFVEKYAPNVTRGGIFLASRDPRPVGELLRFEVSLREGGAVLWGTGRVTWVKEFNPAEPHRPYGMGVQFVAVDPAARPILERLLKRKETAPKPAPPPPPVRPIVDDHRATEQVTPLGENADDKLDESALRRTLERARALASRTEDIEALLGADPEEPRPTLDDALSELPRFLGGRKTSGLFRLPQDNGQSEERDRGEKKKGT